MNALQFGRWFSERRRTYGWPSQHALADSASYDPLLKDCGISEDFLARLEAGHLSHPFRGTVRWRVLMLAWLLCKTQRDLKIYLRAAGFTKLSDQESTQMNLLEKHLSELHTPRPMILPPRPTRFIGRSLELDELLKSIYRLEVGTCAVTGMPGIGKSTLASEALHLLAANERQSLHLFPDGILTFSGLGRRGTNGLISLLHEITTIFHPTSSIPKPTYATYRHTIEPIQSNPSLALSVSSPVPPENAELELPYAVDRARSALAGKSVLLLLDGLDSTFPLRQALEALLARGMHDAAGSRNSREHIRRIVLVTSRYIAPPALVSYHLHMAPLTPQAALELLTDLLGRSLIETEQNYAEQICSAVGYLPLALEMIATSVITKGIPLSLLAARLNQHPLDKLLDSEGEMHSILAQALENLEPKMQEQFALLSMLGTQSFGLESAAALSSNELASTAANLGHFVRYSLLELMASDIFTSPPSPSTSCGNFSVNNHESAPHDSTRYWLHPLLRAYTVEEINQLDQEARNIAQSNIQRYALAYIERYEADTDIQRLEYEREFLLAALTKAWHLEQHEQVIRFATGLSHLAGRLGPDKDGERLLLWGVQASQQLHDRHSLAYFLNRLGALYCYRGELAHARQVWQECIEIADALAGPAYLWHPLIHLAHLAHLAAEYGVAQSFSERYQQHAERSADSRSTALALFKQGYYARLLGDKDKTYDKLNSCLPLLPPHIPDSIPSHEHILELAVHTELARVQGNYTRAQQYTASAITVIEKICDRYGIVDWLLDQAYFAHEQTILDDARLLARRAVNVATQIGAHQFRKRGLILLQQLSDNALHPELHT